MFGRGTRAGFAAVLVVLFAALGGATTGSAKAKPKKRQGTARPNIIVVMTDDMRQDDMFVMRNVKNLIGAQGETFDNSIVSFPLCCASRATFLTGQYAHNHQVQGNHAPEGGHSKLNHANTLAVWLQRDGYAQVDEARRQRLGSLLAVDEGVARIIAAIPAAERANTVVMFTSDNGFYLGERRLPFGKLYPYEEGLRVPLLVRGPGIPKGAHVKSLVANVDLAPTILAFSQTKPGLPQDGRSLVPFFANPAAESNRAYLVESLITSRDTEPILLGVRTQRYFFVQYRGNATGELFDLAVDPYELVSLAKNPAFAGVKAQLQAKLQTLKTCKGPSCAVSSP
jgi:arylsulfatase A-like enzyme